MAAIQRGLDTAERGALGGYLDASVVWSSSAGAAAKAELGWHPSSTTSLYAFGQVSGEGEDAGVGFRWKF